MGSLLLGEGLVEQPDYDGEVAALVVGGEEDGVFVLDGHGGRGGGRVRRRWWRSCPWMLGDMAEGIDEALCGCRGQKSDKGWLWME